MDSGSSATRCRSSAAAPRWAPPRAPLWNWAVWIASSVSKGGSGSGPEPSRPASLPRRDLQGKDNVLATSTLLLLLLRSGQLRLPDSVGLGGGWGRPGCLAAGAAWSAEGAAAGPAESLEVRSGLQIPARGPGQRPTVLVRRGSNPVRVQQASHLCGASNGLPLLGGVLGPSHCTPDRKDGCTVPASRCGRTSPSALAVMTTQQSGLGASTKRSV